MGWDWVNKKDTNYYTRIRLVNKVIKFVKKNYKHNQPVDLVNPVIFSYAGGKIMITSVEFYQYFHEHFQQTKTYVRIHLDNGETFRVDKLRTKHLLELVKQGLR